MKSGMTICLLSLFLFHVTGCQPTAPDADNGETPEESASATAPVDTTAVTTESASESTPAATGADEPVTRAEPATVVSAGEPPAADEPAASEDMEESQGEIMELALDAEDADLPLLEIGSAAPELKIAQWVQGDALAAFPTDQVTVVEFWATWCPPCKASMPHLSQLQERYQDEVVFVGVSDETEEVVSEFLGSSKNEEQTWNEVVNYTIAVDEEEATSTAYLAAARAPGIPTAFVVGKEGIVEWIGHPMSIDEPLQEIVAGTWDREYHLSMQRDIKQLQQAMQESQPESVLSLIEEMVAKYPENLELSFVRFRFLMKLTRWDEARQLMQQFAADNPEKTELIHAMTWISTTSDDPSILETAQRMAEDLSEQAGQQDYDILDTLARIHFCRGNLEEAIRLQEQALQVNGEPDPRLQKSLDKYKEALAEQEESSEQT